MAGFETGKGGYDISAGMLQSVSGEVAASSVVARAVGGQRESLSDRGKPVAGRASAEAPLVPSRPVRAVEALQSTAHRRHPETPPAVVARAGGEPTASGSTTPSGTDGDGTTDGVVNIFAVDPALGQSSRESILHMEAGTEDKPAHDDERKPEPGTRKRPAEETPDDPVKVDASGGIRGRDGRDGDKLPTARDDHEEEPVPHESGDGKEVKVILGDGEIILGGTGSGKSDAFRNYLLSIDEPWRTFPAMPKLEDLLAQVRRAVSETGYCDADSDNVRIYLEEQLRKDTLNKSDEHGEGSTQSTADPGSSGPKEIEILQYDLNRPTEGATIITVPADGLDSERYNLVPLSTDPDEQHGQIRNALNELDRPYGETYATPENRRTVLDLTGLTGDQKREVLGRIKGGERQSEQIAPEEMGPEE